ncbi:MAG: hypothetical protein K6B68_10610 [Eubacterium sp.]|nr:hypothetical protein [Eubacterium sp.]
MQQFFYDDSIEVDSPINEGVEPVKNPVQIADELIDQLDETIETNPDNAIGKAAKLMQNHLKLTKNPLYGEILKENPFYHKIYNTVFTTFPEMNFENIGNDKMLKHCIVAVA